ncbi:MAG: ketoacyl-ACP synthase III [Chitinophagaceae bacterium]|nr:ketoacyl-ACP synthase III [Chitinophagaceae bacterium]
MDQSVWAFDYNLACSGFVYGLAIARGMIETKLAKKILLITADTYSKHINPNDRATSVLFGDGAAANIISHKEDSGIIDIELASSGKEYNSFYIPAGGCRMPQDTTTKEINTDHSGNQTTLEDIQMNGFAVWKFISQTVPVQVNRLLQRNNLTINDIDFFGFHQASKLTLDSLFKSLGVKEDKMYMNLAHIGNTVSASIPIALKDAEDQQQLKRGDLVLLSGFGVGLSWGSLIMKY